MTTKTSILLFLSVFFLSCSSNRTEENQPKNTTPKTLTDSKSSLEIISKRSPDDLVESLYSEILDNDPVLENLENKMRDLFDKKADSTDQFSAFDGKNRSYYHSAANHVANIRDSLLQTKIKALIGNSLERYNAKTARHVGLMKEIESNDQSLSDLRTVLKIIKTLPFIEKYQTSNTPNTHSLENYIKWQKEIIYITGEQTK